MSTVTAFAAAIALAVPAQADTSKQDQQFLSALRSAGFTISSASGVTTEGRMVCNEGLAHGVSVQEIRNHLMNNVGFSATDSSTFIEKAVSVYCPSRSDPIAGIGDDAAAASGGEWWDTPSQGQTACNMAEAAGRDWVVNYGIGDFNGTAEGARFIDALIAKYCPQYAN